MTTTLSTERAQVLSNRIRLLVSLTIGYNVIEAIVAIAAGSVSSSTALIAFGLDSVIEVLSAVAVAWQFAGKDPAAREKTALTIIAISFFALFGYVLIDSVLALWRNHPAEHSPVGIGLTALSLIIMPIFSMVEKRTGLELGSPSAVSDSKQTLLCSLLSGAVLLGLVLNATLGWWQADPLCALIVAVMALKEGVEAARGESCATPMSDLTRGDGHPTD